MDVIYKLTSPNKKVYIGRSDNLNRRLTEHKHAAYKKQCKNSLYRAIRKYGWENFTKEIICEIEPEKVQLLEEQFIQAYDSVRKGYNDTYVGAGGDQWKDRYDTIEYMEFVEKMRNLNKGDKNGMFGKNHGESTITQMKQKAKGRFSLIWFIDRNGIEDGTRMYNERCTKLRNRNMKKDKNGKFIKK